MAAIGRSAQRVLADQRTFCRNSMRQIMILRRIHAVDAVAEKRNRRAAGLERATMCGSIYSLRQAADDAVAAFCEVPGKFDGVEDASSRWIAATDDCQRRQV